ncbi:hypothetical protein ACLB2K_059673 [Fragaria x ananassa]
MARARSHQLSCQRIVEPTASPSKQVTTLLYAENFRCVASGAGLFMEESLTTGVFRIRNFATGQVLYLPDAHDSTGGVHVGFAFDFHPTDVEWRTLKLPSQNESRVMISRRIARAIPNQGVAHLVDLIEVGKDFQLEVLSFDLWSECFTVTTLPQGVFKDLHRVSILRWKDYIAVAGIVGEALNVLVLQDFKEHKWSNITVPLEFLKHDPVLKDQIKPILATRFGKLQFTNPVRNDILEYDMEREKITATGTKSTEQKIYLVKASLVTLKGMK